MCFHSMTKKHCQSWEHRSVYGGVNSKVMPLVCVRYKKHKATKLCVCACRHVRVCVCVLECVCVCVCVCVYVDMHVYSDAHCSVLPSRLMFAHYSTMPNRKSTRLNSSHT